MAFIVMMLLVELSTAQYYRRSDRDDRKFDPKHSKSDRNSDNGNHRKNDAQRNAPYDPFYPRILPNDFHHCDLHPDLNAPQQTTPKSSRQTFDFENNDYHHGSLRRLRRPPKVPRATL